MGNILKVAKFNFITLFNRQILICSAILLLHLLISAAVIRLANTEGPAGSNDVIVMCFALIMGLVYFPLSFKYILSQGISRKRFFLAMCLSFTFLAAIFALLSAIFYVINLKIANVWMVYETAYGDRSIPGMVVWVFSVSLFLGVLGWFIRLIYYVSGRNMQIFIAVAPFILAPVLLFLNILADGTIFSATGRFLGKVIGYSTTNPNPYIGVASMVAAAVILSGLVFLLLRRAQIKDQ
ncbi:MAG: hypothetical protein JXQ30_16705 [Spirochaetes bacterium]|nr:hypothetical protein [Spirochaetota bacterium]